VHIPPSEILMAGKIPVTVITGFLGSGKTTLIRNLLLNNQGKRIAVLVNEFGELGIDGDCYAVVGSVTKTVPRFRGRSLN
jgi:G3E family GTPase